MFHLSDGVTQVIKVIMTIESIVVFIHLAFYTVLSVVGLKKPKRTYSIREDKHRFLFIIPAHNEEKVIGNCLESLRNLDYKKSLYQAVVLADHCKDKTAEVVRQYPEYQLFENTYKEGESRGKPHVIGRYLNKFKDYWECYDYIVFLDADNLVSPNFLKELNSQFLENPEYTVIQGYLDSKNIDESIMSRGYAAAYFITNRAIQYAKHLLKWNASIGGTGFAIDTDYIKEHGWNPRSYTEDFEIQVELSIKGKRSTWNHFGKVYDEKPNKMRASHVQRTRWSQGHWLIAISKTALQVRSLFQRQSIVQLMNRFETLVYSYSMMRAVWIFTFICLTIIDIRWMSEIPHFFSLFWFWLIFEIIGYIVMPVIFLRQEGKEYFSRLGKISRMREYILLYFGYFYSSILYYFAQVKGFFTWYFPQNNWKKTEHSSTANSIIQK